MEKKLLIPFWTKIFKKIGIDNPEYIAKYREYIHQQRYKKHINDEINNIRDKEYDEIQRKIEKLIKEKYATPEFKIIM